jgi:hypothetical protein
MAPVALLSIVPSTRESVRSLTERTDDELMLLAAAGHALAFEGLVRRHQPALRAFCQRMCGPLRSDDVAQDVFVALYRAREAYLPEGTPQPPSGYAAPPQQGGYAAPAQPGGYAAPPSQGGYAAPPQQGYAAPPQQGSATSQQQGSPQPSGQYGGQPGAYPQTPPGLPPIFRQRRGYAQGGAYQQPEQSGYGQSELDPAWQQREAQKRRSIGLRLGYGLPSGKLATGFPMKDITTGAVLFQGDFTFPMTAGLQAGMYLNFGVGLKGDEYSDRCEASDTDCSVFAWGLGAMGEYRFLPSQPVDPWVGLTLGIDGLSQSYARGSYDETLTAYGFNVGANAGVDFKLGSVVLGPYAGVAIGRYWSLDYNVNGVDQFANDGVIDDPAGHYWMSLGARGRFDI